MISLIYGDNLKIMREMEAGHIDLICTDPPFNSGRNYNAFFPESKAQSKAFEDIWKWDNEAIEARGDIRERAEADNTYQALDMCLEGYDLVLQKSVSGNKGAMRAYLAFMGPRLAEMHRLLKNSGSIYLHCDPTASHYIKGIMDAIFDQGNRKKNEHFRNEIVWAYQRWTGATKHFQRMHDIILFYGKAGKLTKFNTLTEPYSEKSKHKGKRHTTFQDDGGIEQTYTDTSREKAMRDVWEISCLNSQSKERTGYPTQKPLALLDRIIKASSNEGDLVMDPFLGSGTTAVAAKRLNRSCIGIEINPDCIEIAEQRLKENV